MGLVVEGKKISPRNNSIFFQLQWPHTKLQIKENIFTNVKHSYFIHMTLNTIWSFDEKNLTHQTFHLISFFKIIFFVQNKIKGTPFLS